MAVLKTPALASVIYSRIGSYDVSQRADQNSDGPEDSAQPLAAHRIAHAVEQHPAEHGQKHQQDIQGQEGARLLKRAVVQDKNPSFPKYRGRAHEPQEEHVDREGSTEVLGPEGSLVRRVHEDAGESVRSWLTRAGVVGSVG